MKTRTLSPLAIIALSPLALPQTPPASEPAPSQLSSLPALSIRLDSDSFEEARRLRLDFDPQEEGGDRKRPPFYVPLYGINLGFQRFTSGRTRDVFGDRAFSIAPGFGPVFARNGISIRPGLAVFNSNNEVRGVTNKALFVSIGPLVRYSFGSPVDVREVGGEREFRIRPFQPYIEAGIGLVYADVTAQRQGISEKRLTYGGSFALGTTVTKNAFVQLRFRAVPDIESYKFGSAGIDFGFRF